MAAPETCGRPSSSIAAMASAMALGLSLGGCNGAIGDPGLVSGAEDENGIPGAPPVDTCDRLEVGPTLLPRMTRAAYNNTVRDLLGTTSTPADRFPADEAEDFDNAARAHRVSLLLAEGYGVAAAELAREATADVEAFVGCSLGAPGCVRSFVETLGRRAYRRPLSVSELDEHVALYESFAAVDGSETAVRLFVETLLRSPFFLYRVEEGEPVPGDPTIRKLTGDEVATRLSYFLWRTMPDDALFEAADMGRLATAEQVGDQARRMLADPRARATLADFHDQWLGLSEIELAVKSSEVFPEFEVGLLPLMREQIKRFAEDVVMERDGSLRTLLRSNETFATGELSDYLGYPGSASVGEWSPIVLPADRYAGVLTHPGLLAVHASGDETNPVLRGKLVRERFFCQPLPAPPDDVPALPDVDPSATTRERYEQHVSDPVCASCHELTDAFGFALEHFDATGRWRDEDNGQPVDASAVLTRTDVDGTVSDHLELIDRLTESGEVERCVVQQWFRYANGRSEASADRCSLDQLGEVFQRSGGDLRELLVALTQTHAFRFRTAVEAMEEP